ncbi:hypothetical protein PR202_gn00239 [Eleusine coracana subsp. coracana]|uniref:Uncharacterized protein n=1 Tax=Eleusine coracana subsp. coracana TaxID=191504 RepID=A0AAV5FYR5_ELECO|nr:hypothetical protein PR202_gn00134 [Eleusine coracana subsp. coracana]GJN40926.1 hypothetical protein PR202_gn00239 [Eleusine coracana subsp. coracana]
MIGGGQTVKTLAPKVLRDRPNEVASALIRLGRPLNAMHFRAQEHHGARLHLLLGDPRHLLRGWSEQLLLKHRLHRGGSRRAIGGGTGVTPPLLLGPPPQGRRAGPLETRRRGNQTPLGKRGGPETRSNENWTSSGSSIARCFAATTPDKTAQGIPLFEFSELAKATENFSCENKIGEGGFGYVYKAWNVVFTERSIRKLIHSSLFGQSYSGQIRRCAHVALLCVQDDPAARPSMSDVVVMPSHRGAGLPTPDRPGADQCHKVVSPHWRPLSPLRPCMPPMLAAACPVHAIIAGGHLLPPTLMHATAACTLCVVDPWLRIVRLIPYIVRLVPMLPAASPSTTTALS